MFLQNFISILTIWVFLRFSKRSKYKRGGLNKSRGVGFFSENKGGDVYSGDKSSFIQIKKCLQPYYYYDFTPLNRPLNMLDNYENRKGYMLAFGITVSSIVAVFLADNRKLIGELDDFVQQATNGRPYITSKSLLFIRIFANK